MADLGNEGSVTLAAKVGSAGMAGALWGVFATFFLMVPAVITGVIFPFAKKAQSALNNKINETAQPAKALPRKMTKAEREYEARLAELNADKEEAQLRAKLERLSKRKARRTEDADNSVHTV